MGVKTNKNNLPSPILRNATKYGKNQIVFFFVFHFDLVYFLKIIYLSYHKDYTKQYKHYSAVRYVVCIMYCIFMYKVAWDICS